MEKQLKQNMKDCKQESDEVLRKKRISNEYMLVTIFP